MKVLDLLDERAPHFLRHRGFHGIMDLVDLKLRSQPFPTPKPGHLMLSPWHLADVIGDALIITAAFKAGCIEGDAVSTRVPYVSFEGDVNFTPEGDKITEAVPQSSMVVVQTQKLAVLARVSREQFQQGSSAGLLASSMRAALVGR